MEIKITLAQFVQALVNMSDWHSINDGHNGRVADMAVKIGDKLKLPSDDLFYLKWGAELHDIGRVGVDDSVLSKKGKLTESQFGAVKSHPEIGYKVIKDTLPAPICEIVLYHQECFNGTGYPEGLFGEAIPCLARIVKIADVWDALTNNRPYRKALTPDHALHIMNLEKDDFDPQVYAVFLGLLKSGEIR